VKFPTDAAETILTVATPQIPGKEREKLTPSRGADGAGRAVLSGPPVLVVGGELWAGVRI